MTSLKLSDQQRLELQCLASHTPLAKERCRAQAMSWLDEGATVEQVAGSLFASRQAVYNWIDRRQGRSELDRRRRRADAPRPARPRAGHGDVDVPIAQVIDTDPRQLGYHSTAWAAPLLRQYLRDHHAIDASRKTISRAIARPAIRRKRPRHQLSLRPGAWRQSRGG